VSQSKLFLLLALCAASYATTRPSGSFPGNQSQISQTTPILVFQTSPTSGTVGSEITPAIVVALQDTKGNPLSSAANPITLTLQGNGSTGTLEGSLVLTPSGGRATFSKLSITMPGASYQIVASSPGVASVTSAPFSILPVTTSTFVPPPPNECQSAYDRFYSSEPGVYAYWAFCESGCAIPTVHDYVGNYEFNASHQAWFGPASATMTAISGPVPDGETALATNNGQIYHAQNLVINRNAGTIAAWMNMGLLSWPTIPFGINSVTGSTQIYPFGQASSGAICFGYNVSANGNSAGIWAPQAKCGIAPNTWHRLVLTWSGRTISYYVDGFLANFQTLSGSGPIFDNSVYAYNFLFGQDGSGKQVSIAKALISNQAWSAAQVATDYIPTLISSVPRGGVYVSSTHLGTIHTDVLGYAENNSDLSSPALAGGLLTGLKTAGVTALRYAGGPGGISADTNNWQSGGVACTSTEGVPAAANQSASTQNTIDNYLGQIAQPLRLHVGYTVNYGTNPPLCNAGGDPVINGANLVAYANNEKHYGIKYWEIGNEQFNGGGSEPDFHSNPGTGTSYAANEPAFYADMKAEDPTIQIGIPIGLGVYNWLANFDLPAMAGASYDAVVYHNYPVSDPITDGATLYPERRAGNVGNTRGELLTIQTMLLNAGKTADVWITEWDADSNGGGPWSRQSMGAVMPLYGAMQLSEFMRAGVTYATWWTQGIGSDCNPYFYDYQGETAYAWYDYCGGIGLVYPGPYPVAETQVGLVAGDIMPIAHAFQILSQSGFVTEGEHMLDTQTDLQNAPWLLSYGATHGTSYAVILINRDRDNAHTVPVAIEGRSSGASVTQWTYGRAQYDQTYFGNWSGGLVSSDHGAWSGTYQADLPPWSVNVLIFN
jgi:hypothetical protein